MKDELKKNVNRLGDLYALIPHLDDDTIVKMYQLAMDIGKFKVDDCKNPLDGIKHLKMGVAK